MQGPPTIKPAARNVSSRPPLKPQVKPNTAPKPSAPRGDIVIGPAIIAAVAGMIGKK